jgi:hypothetical protein
LADPRAVNCETANGTAGRIMGIAADAIVLEFIVSALLAAIVDVSPRTAMRDV